MSDRLTPDWTDTSEQAFGEKGAQGDRGELEAITILESLGFEVEHHPSDRHKQEQGHDLVLDNKYGVDVKANLHHGKDVCVEWPKLLRSKATFWFHINPKDSTDYIMYKVADMKKHIGRSYKKLYWVKRDIAANL